MMYAHDLLTKNLGNARERRITRCIIVCFSPLLRKTVGQMKAQLLLLGMLALGFSQSPRALADSTSLLDSLAGTWNDLDSFASMGQCILSPTDSLFYLCSPAHLTRVRKPRFEGRGMISATD